MEGRHARYRRHTVEETALIRAYGHNRVLKVLAGERVGKGGILGALGPILRALIRAYRYRHRSVPLPLPMPICLAYALALECA